MELVFYFVVSINTLSLLYLAGKPSINFPYVYIVLSVLNEWLITDMTTFSGYPSLIRGLYLLCILIFMIRFKIKNLLVLNLLFLYMGLFMFFYSTDVTFLRFFYKISYIFFVLSFFPVGSILVKDEKFMQKLVLVCKILPVIALLYYVSIFFLGIEGKGYSEEFSSGAISKAKINMLAFSGVILFVFLYTKYIPRNLVNLFCIVTALSLLIINAKRASLLIAIIGIIITILYFRISIQKLAGVTLISVLVIFVLSDVAGSIVSAQYEARARRMTIQGVQEEGRYKEYEVLPQYIIDYIGTRELFIGHGFIDNYGYRYEYLGLTHRAIHTDIVMLLYAIGLLGFFMYSLFFIKMLQINREVAKTIKASKGQAPELLIPLGYAMLAMILGLHFVGGVFSIGGATSLAFLVLGFLYGLSNVIKSSRAVIGQETFHTLPNQSPSAGPVYPRDPGSI